MCGSGADLGCVLGRHGKGRRRLGRKNLWTYKKRRGGNRKKVVREGVGNGSGEAQTATAG
jgi:hypothetical protein